MSVKVISELTQEEGVYVVVKKVSVDIEGIKEYMKKNLDNYRGHSIFAPSKSVIDIEKYLSGEYSEEELKARLVYDDYNTYSCNKGSFEWITARKVYVPYNDDVLTECIKTALNDYITNQPSMKNLIFEDCVANKSAELYFASDYYINTFTELSEKWSKFCKDTYSKNFGYYINKCKKLIKMFANEVSTANQLKERLTTLVDNMPKTTPKRVVEEITELRRIADKHYRKMEEAQVEYYQNK